MVRYEFNPYESKTANQVINNNGLPTYEEAMTQDYPMPSRVDSNLSNPSNKFKQLQAGYPPSCIPLPKDIEVEQSDSGIYSKDPVLNKDELLLKSFIYHYNDKPKMFITINGYHNETYYETIHYYEDGQSRSRTESRERRVDDFNINIDLTEYVSEKGIIHNPDLQGNAEQEVESAIKNYVSSDKYLKELKVIKEVIWDYEHLTQAISNMIRRQGYTHYIEIKFPLKNQRVKVRNNNLATKCIHDPIGKIICVLSCFCIVAWPLAYIAKKNYADKLRASFNMEIPTEVWYQQNIESILEQVPSVW